MTVDAPEPLRLVRHRLALSVLQAIARQQFGDLVKAVVDVAAGMMVIGGELHADEEAYLLDIGSEQRDLWGINLYPDQFGTEDFVEFDSMINLRPSRGNRTRSVDDAAARQAIVEIVATLVHADA
ncbi:MAG: DUF5674 family protein [Acidimicrobiales bacterium]